MLKTLPVLLLSLLGSSTPKSVLLIIADDLGINALQAYNLRDDPVSFPFPNTPNIDFLINNGILFNNFYSYPICSSARASIQTGIGTAVTSNTTTIINLPITETIIPEVLDLNPQLHYNHALIGKWHLSSIYNINDPNNYGYNFFSGTMANIENYCAWNKITNGQQIQNYNVYATTDNINDAINWISNQDNNWFLTLAFNAPHSPYHIPPSSDMCVSVDNGNFMQEFNLMIEKMDYEIGRLLSYINLDETTIIFIGDNGSAQEATVSPFDSNKSKGTMYEGGIRAPLIVSGNQVVNPGRESNILVNSVDLFSTSLELMGVNVPMTLPCSILDSQSFLPEIKDQPFSSRTYVISERFDNGHPENADFCIRDNTGYKFIHLKSGTEKFYNLNADPYEHDDLLLTGVLRNSSLNKMNELKDIIMSLRDSGNESSCSVCNNNSDCGENRWCNSSLHVCVDSECLFDKDCLGESNGNQTRILRRRGCCFSDGTCHYGSVCNLK